MNSDRPISRRALLRGAGGAAALLGAAAAEPAAAQQKVSQVEAKYQTSPKGQQRCEICVNFQPPAACRFVAGTISSSGWCQFFAARENAH